MNFKDFNFDKTIETKNIELNNGSNLIVQTYLPMDLKIDMLNFIIDGALDDLTGCFSPVRTEVYFSLALCHYYAGIDFDSEDLAKAGETYDALELNGVTAAIIEAIPTEELEFTQDLVNTTLEDIAKYNCSAAGIIHNMSSGAEGLNGEIGSILEKIKNAEGLETLSVIKDVVGSN